MRILLICSGLFCALLVVTAPAEAQMCVGAPSFRNQPYQVGVSAGFTDGAQGVGGQFAAGGEALFGGAAVGVVNFRDLDSRATNVSAFVGADLATSQAQRVFVCPAAAISFGTGPDVGPIEVSTFGLRAGASVGVVAAQTDVLMVIPTFGLTADYTRATGELARGETTESDTSGHVSIGVGFVFNRNVGITPSLSIPFSAAGADPIFNMGLTFNFGR